MNTRFRPTPYRDLHLGHAWVAYHNWKLAAASGGEFVFLVDDIIYRFQYLMNNGFELGEAVTRNVEDLEWLGCKPTRVAYSSHNAEAHASAAKKLRLSPPGLYAGESFQGHYVITPGATTPLLMYHPWVTMTRVVDDYELRVNAFVRGDEWHLRGEVQLYDWFYRSLYGGNPPMQDYVPVVRREENPDKESKALNAVTLRKLAETGYTAQEVLDTLRECAAQSAAKGLRDVLIPEGVLDTDEHATIALKASQAQRWEDQAESYATETEDWAWAARRTVARMTERFRRGQKSLGEGHRNADRA